MWRASSTRAVWTRAPRSAAGVPLALGTYIYVHMCDAQWGMPLIPWFARARDIRLWSSILDGLLLGLVPGEEALRARVGS